MAENFGGMSLAEIETSSREQPFPDDAGVSPVNRFVSKVAALVTTRNDKGEAGGVAVFLQSEALRTDAIVCGGTSFPFLATGNDNIGGQVWLSNSVLGEAYRVDIDCVDLSKLFDALRDQGLAKLPALLVDWRGAIPIGRFYQNGVDDADVVDDVQLIYAEISESEMKACLDHAHKTALATPARVKEGHSEPIWTKPLDGWPAERPEEKIHGKIIHHLRARFAAHKVRAEQYNDDGYLDLIIYSNRYDNAGGKIVVKEWVLELKTLTDRTHTGNTVAQAITRTKVSDGVIQAISYREQEHARQAALCCYDMRKSDEGDTACFAHVVASAGQGNLFLWRWFILRSSKESRNNQFALSSASATL